MSETGTKPSPMRSAARRAVDASCLDLWRELRMAEDLCPDELTGLERDIQGLLAGHPAVRSEEPGISS